ncbi:TPA: hypothetical protein EYQ19_02375 [Candidatus Pacearchaeota archaeon]|nr:hypothetical protein [Candidatus Pacearchaeota archaeon]
MLTSKFYILENILFFMVNNSGKTNLNDQIKSSEIPEEPLSKEESLKKFQDMKKELDNFKNKILKKFPFIQSISLLPSQAFKIFEEEEGVPPEEAKNKPLHLMMIVPEEEFKNISKKIKPEVIKISLESKHKLWVHIKTPIDVWNYGMDSKFEFLDAIGNSIPVHDEGILGSIRVSVIHKTLVLRKFEKYVASYCVGGSLVRGTADETSDVDTFIVIDDTDVKRMPRLQLLDRLRGMIHDYIREATAIAGVKNILNVQVYLLTDFWDKVKDSEPVMFTFIRDGVPLFDRGTFLPWKLLLQMGKIKPSPEAIDKYMKFSEQSDELVKKRMMDAMQDIYWGIVTPTQALMMLSGQGPPAPKTIVQDAKKLFVQEQKIMSLKDLKVLEKAVKYYKDYEHGKLKSIPGKEIDLLLKEAAEYDKKMKSLRNKLEAKLVIDSGEKVTEEVFGLLKNIFGNKARSVLIKEFDKKLVKTGKMQKRFLPVLKKVDSIKQKIKSKKLSQTEMDLVRREAGELIRELVDYSQRKELASVEKGVIFVQGKDRKGEVVLTDIASFFVEGGKFRKFTGKGLVDSNSGEFEDAMKKTEDRTKVSFDSNVLDILKKEIGEFSLTI